MEENIITKPDSSRIQLELKLGDQLNALLSASHALIETNQPVFLPT